MLNIDCVTLRLSLLRTVADAGEGSHYTDFDCKVMDYMGKLRREDTVKNYVSQTRTTRY